MRAFFVALTVLVVACGSASQDNPRPMVAQQALAATIGSAGGTLYASDGSGISIPPGALSEDVTITMLLESDPPATEEDGAPVGDTWLLGPEGQQFAKPITVTVAFNPQELDSDETANDVVVYTSPLVNPDYEPLETTVADSTHVSVETTHFSHYSARHRALAPGEYVSTAENAAESAYIGDWRENGGYVLGYFLKGAKIYANTYYEHSVYGLIGNSGYGAWDHGHHCGWIEFNSHVRGNVHHVKSRVADVCPAWDNNFALTHGGPQLFRPGSWHESDGDVQSAVVLPSCTDMTVYANYDPVTHTFSNPDGKEVANRGTIIDLRSKADEAACDSFSQKDVGGVAEWQAYEDVDKRNEWVTVTGNIDPYSTTRSFPSDPAVTATSGYCGFGTRFVTSDNVAVEIKDSRREGSGFSAFGFMHAECIAGIKVGYPTAPPPSTPPPTGDYCCAVCSNAGGQAYYAAEDPGSTCAEAAATFCAFKSRGSLVSSSEGTCPLAPASF